MWIKCSKDGKECDLNTNRKSCRYLKSEMTKLGYMPGWTGKCSFRLQMSGHAPKPPIPTMSEALPGLVKKDD